MRVEVNQTAPDFFLPAVDGTSLQLRSLRGRKVILFFYPRDESPGCTVQACGFRDAYEQLTASGAEVVGVSRDSSNSHRKFCNNRNLPFPILSDSDGAVCRRYGANSLLLFGNTGRVTYLIDEDGIVAAVFSSLFRPFEHVRRACDWVKKIHKDGEDNLSTALKI